MKGYFRSLKHREKRVDGTCDAEADKSSLEARINLLFCEGCKSRPPSERREEEDSSYERSIAPSEMRVRMGGGQLRDERLLVHRVYLHC